MFSLEKESLKAPLIACQLRQHCDGAREWHNYTILSEKNWCSRRCRGLRLPYGGASTLMTRGIHHQNLFCIWCHQNIISVKFLLTVTFTPAQSNRGLQRHHRGCEGGGQTDGTHTGQQFGSWWFFVLLSFALNLTFKKNCRQSLLLLMPLAMPLGTDIAHTRFLWRKLEQSVLI